jgi:hypothetical protein
LVRVKVFPGRPAKSMMMSARSAGARKSRVEAVGVPSLTASMLPASLTGVSSSPPSVPIWFPAGRLRDRSRG